MPAVLLEHLLQTKPNCAVYPALQTAQSAHTRKKGLHAICVRPKGRVGIPSSRSVAGGTTNMGGIVCTQDGLHFRPRMCVIAATRCYQSLCVAESKNIKFRVGHASKRKREAVTHACRADAHVPQPCNRKYARGPAAHHMRTTSGTTTPSAQGIRPPGQSGPLKIALRHCRPRFLHGPS